MNCVHKPKLPGLIISTESGKFFIFSRSQYCRKCERQIVMVHKGLYKTMSAILFFIAVLFLFLWGRLPFGLPVRLVCLFLYVAIYVWLFKRSGNIMKWKAIGLPDEGNRLPMDEQE